MLLEGLDIQPRGPDESAAATTGSVPSGVLVERTTSDRARSVDGEERAREAVLRNLYSERAELLDLEDAGKLTDVGRLELAQMDQAIDYWESVEQQATVAPDRVQELRAIAGDLMAVQAKLARRA